MNNKEFTEKYYIDRSKQTTVKWLNAKKEGFIPMWVADMDFKDDERIIKALSDFINTGDYGYSNLPEDYYDTFIKWHETRNSVTYKREWIRFTKGAVDAMYQLIYALTEEKDNILISTPLYPPFKGTIEKTGRKVVESKMINTDGYFTYDYADIERKLKTRKVKMMMICSPHNPVGRVFKKGELEELFDLCKKYNVIVVADEVHSDIIMPDQTFYPTLSYKKYMNNIISITAVSKTFSLAVYSHCHVVIPSKKLRDKFDKYQQHYHLSSVNCFNALPSYYGYKYGSEWLDNVNNVIYENYTYLKKELSPYFEMAVLEGSYLLFVNIGKYNTQDSAAKLVMDECKIRVNPGESFGKDYNNWVRINLATSLSNVKKAVKNLKKLVK
ncbi:MAG: aminotransferase class I/II-fold pyridoxal phosphate-dependent enzyme [Erysipelotrichaceae bacterium]|nr:aminotransferase class I/II-fold pyridoxal phosphate-dependent enzyme [Erysipelotrichaceae bacterium]